MSDGDTTEHVKALATIGPSKGGKARAAALTPEERSNIARVAAASRWDKEDPIPYATHMGELQIGDGRILCANLSNGQRVLTQETFLIAIGRSPKAKAGTGSERFFQPETPLEAYRHSLLLQICSPSS